MSTEEKSLTIAVVGTGQMGPAIAQSCAMAGHDAVVLARSQTSIERARARVQSNLQAMLPYGLVRQEEVPSLLSRISYREDGFAALADAELIIECVTEDLPLKQELFAELECACRRDTILLSTTSGLRCTDIAARMKRPERAIVGHYWNPPHLLPLVEVSPGEKTSPVVVDTVIAFLRTTGHTPVVCRKEVVGFVANRLQQALQREALAIVEQGIATPQEVDDAVKTGFGARTPVLGVFEHMDLVGLDLIEYMHNYILGDLDAQQHANAILIERVQRGDLGAKTGKGFYDWSRKSAADVLRERDTLLLELAAKRMKQARMADKD
jgi:3-hydroxybutyryl-CoA dehydrogenase